MYSILLFDDFQDDVKDFGTIAHHFYNFTQEAINGELLNCEDYDHITEEVSEIRPIEILRPKINGKNKIAQDYTAFQITYNQKNNN